MIGVRTCSQNQTISDASLTNKLQLLHEPSVQHTDPYVESLSTIMATAFGAVPEQIRPTVNTIERVVDRILHDRKITRSDQQMFMSALLSKNSLSLDDQIQVNRVFDALKRGLLKVVD